MSHVTRMNESHMWMGHGTHTNKSRHTYEWITSHIWMSHVTHMNASRHTWMSHVTHTNECAHKIDHTMRTHEYGYGEKYMTKWDLCAVAEKWGSARNHKLLLYRNMTKDLHWKIPLLTFKGSFNQGLCHVTPLALSIKVSKGIFDGTSVRWHRTSGGPLAR